MAGAPSTGASSFGDQRRSPRTVHFHRVDQRCLNQSIVLGFDRVLISFCAFWGDSNGIWWVMMVSDELWWVLMVSDELWWFLMGSDETDVDGTLMVSDEFRWFLVNSDGFWWVMMVSDEFWWFLMSYDGFWWVLISYDGFWWVMMGYDNFWCIVMFYDEFCLNQISWDLFQSDAIVLGLPTTHVYSVTVNLRTSPPAIQTFLKSDEIINYKLEVWWETNDPWIMVWFRSWAPPGTMVQPPYNQCNKVQLPRKIVLEFETTKLVFEKWAPTFASHVPDLANQYCAWVLEFLLVTIKISQS